jgi:prophage DNA circulation protein
MGWRDNLLPASFRGAPFQYLTAARGGGRRLAEHEFPLRNDPYIEDMGRRKRTHKITGYVIGDDYMAQRDALERALDGDGPGTLVHPYRGPIQVNIGSYTVQEIVDEGRIARFDFECVESGGQPSPVSANATGDAAVAAGNDLFAQLESGFAAAWPGIGQDEVELLLALEVLFVPLVGWPGIDTTGFSQLARDLVLLTSNQATLAGNVTGFCRRYAAAAVASIAPYDENLSSRGPQIDADPTFGLSALFAAAESLGGDARHKKRAREALAMLVTGSAAAGAVQIVAQTEFDAQDDADAARDLVTAMVDAVTTRAAEAADDAAFAVCQTLFGAASTDLTIRAKQVPSTVEYRFGGAQPSVVLAQRFYGDAGRAAELVARNGAPHPLFMPPSVRALSA